MDGTRRWLVAARVDCSKLYVRKDEFGGDGVYAAVPLRKGELVERGIVRRVAVDGHDCPYVFTWSEDRTVWALGSGCSTFYNSPDPSDPDGPKPNSHMVRYFDEDRFEIFATADIAPDEELFHKYRSLEWRRCFKQLKG